MAPIYIYQSMAQWDLGFALSERCSSFKTETSPSKAQEMIKMKRTYGS